MKKGTSILTSGKFCKQYNCAKLFKKQVLRTGEMLSLNNPLWFLSNIEKQKQREENVHVFRF